MTGNIRDVDRRPPHMDHGMRSASLDDCGRQVNLWQHLNEDDRHEHP